MAQVADMSGKTVVVTGGNSGIGLETAVALAGAGARVVVTARDGARGEKSLGEIERRSGSSSLDLAVFDLGSLASVRAGAAEILERCDRIDVLVNNAGIVHTERRITSDGLEATFAVNHLGPFLLTELLRERIVASAPSRVVNVSSTSHKSARRGIDLDDLQSEQRYSGMRVYAKSKLANIYFTTELARRLAGTGVTVNCLHPGTVRTGWGADGDAKGPLGLGLMVARPFFTSPAKGARTTVYLASAPEVARVTGAYFIRCRPARTSKAAHDPAAARRLWEASEELIAEHASA